VDRAIEIARRVNMPLKIAAKVDGKDKAYFDAAVKPLLSDRRIEFIGEIGEDDKDSFLGDAAALLFPIDWPEPFGLVMIEAMACGTPVVAYRCGSVPEVMRDGVSGFVVDEMDRAVEATARAVELPRGRCRAYFESRFLADRMAAGYVQVYEGLVAQERHDEGHGRTAIGLAAIDTEDHDERAATSTIAGGHGVELT
jgi:glycosyltransferase involved in cell wall biosynthesis